MRPKYRGYMSKNDIAFAIELRTEGVLWRNIADLFGMEIKTLQRCVYRAIKAP